MNALAPEEFLEAVARRVNAAYVTVLGARGRLSSSLQTLDKSRALLRRARIEIVASRRPA